MLEPVPADVVPLIFKDQTQLNIMALLGILNNLLADPEKSKP
jgi:hypothetical protein